MFKWFFHIDVHFPTAFCVRMYRSVKGKLVRWTLILFSNEVSFCGKEAIMLTAFQKLSVEIIKLMMLAFSCLEKQGQIWEIWLLSRSIYSYLVCFECVVYSLTYVVFYRAIQIGNVPHLFNILWLNMSGFFWQEEETSSCVEVLFCQRRIF